MAVDLQELLLGNQAAILASSAQNFSQTMDLQNKVALNKFDEVALLEAAAAKDLGKMGADPRYLPNGKSVG